MTKSKQEWVTKKQLRDQVEVCLEISKGDYVHGLDRTKETASKIMKTVNILLSQSIQEERQRVVDMIEEEILKLPGHGTLFEYIKVKDILKSISDLKSKLDDDNNHIKFNPDGTTEIIGINKSDIKYVQDGETVNYDLSDIEASRECIVNGGYDYSFEGTTHFLDRFGDSNPLKTGDKVGKFVSCVGKNS